MRTYSKVHCGANVGATIVAGVSNDIQNIGATVFLISKLSAFINDQFIAIDSLK